MNTNSQWSKLTIGLLCTCESGVARSQSQHGQVSLAAVNHILKAYVFPEVMNSCKTLKIH